MSTFVTIIAAKREDLAELELFAGICAQSIRQASKAVEGIELKQRIASLLGDPPPYQSEAELAEAKDRATKISEFASAQKANGAPYLFSLCAVRLWALMEALVDELIVEAMRQPQLCCDQSLIGKLKGPLVEFLAASKDEQAEFLAETLKQSVDAALKVGIGRFEAVLSPVGLGGQVDDAVRKALFELGQVRNIIVHKSGKADRRLVEACPWLGVARGAEVHVSATMFRRYLMATYWYLVEIRGRIDERAGKTRTDEVKHALNLLAPLLNAEPKLIPRRSENSQLTETEGNDP
jgi:hypothetical protein